LEEYVGGCGDGILDSGEECDQGALNGLPCEPDYGSDGSARSCQVCNEDCTLGEIIEDGPFAGDGIVQEYYGEECDDGNKIDGGPGDFCYNACTKRYMDEEGDVQQLDTSLAALDTYKTDPNNSLDSKVNEINKLLTDVYDNVNSGTLEENQKLAQLKIYQKDLSQLEGDTQVLILDVIKEMEAILSL